LKGLILRHGIALRSKAGVEAQGFSPVKNAVEKTAYLAAAGPAAKVEDRSGSPSTRVGHRRATLFAAPKIAALKTPICDTNLHLTPRQMHKFATKFRPTSSKALMARLFHRNACQAPSPKKSSNPHIPKEKKSEEIDL